MKDNLPEKGAIVQRDRETYAIAPQISGGLVDPATLRKMAMSPEVRSFSPQDLLLLKE